MSAKELTRNDFLRISAGLVGITTLPFGLGCPSDDTGDEGADSGADTAGDTAGDTTDGGETTAAAGCDSEPGTVIGTNHGHTATVPLADVEAGVEATYDIMGGSPHAHSITLSAADFATLQQGMQVTVTSTLGDGHTHDVTVTCG
jgi:hypothetical protein